MATNDYSVTVTIGATGVDARGKTAVLEYSTNGGTSWNGVTILQDDTSNTVEVTLPNDGTSTVQESGYVPANVDRIRARIISVGSCLNASTEDASINYT